MHSILVNHDLRFNFGIKIFKGYKPQITVYLKNQLINK